MVNVATFILSMIHERCINMALLCYKAHLYLTSLQAFYLLLIRTHHCTRGHDVNNDCHGDHGSKACPRADERYQPICCNNVFWLAYVLWHPDHSLQDIRLDTARYRAPQGVSNRWGCPVDPKRRCDDFYTKIGKPGK